MMRFRTQLLAAGASLTLALPVSALPAFAQGTASQQSPAINGTVASYTLVPWGNVDGFLLTDGTEVHVPPMDGAALVYTVKPGDAVTIQGRRTPNGASVMATSVTNDTTHATVTVEPFRRGHHEDAPMLDATGTIKAPLHNPRGSVDGVLLADGTQVRLPPHDATRLADMLGVGKTISVTGEGYQGPLGHMIIARSIGPDAQHMTQIALPHPHHPGTMPRHPTPRGPEGAPPPSSN